MPPTLTDRVRKLTDGPLSRTGLALHRLGVHPDVITWAGIALVLAATVLIGGGYLRAGGALLVVGSLLDALDGAVARARGQMGGFGALLDSTLDRYADGFIFASLGYYFAVLGQPNNLLLALAALIGTYCVSYIRARAGEADVGHKVEAGAFTRLERLVAVVVLLMLPSLLVPGLWLLAVGTNATALQRLWVVFRRDGKRD